MLYAKDSCSSPYPRAKIVQPGHLQSRGGYPVSSSIIRYDDPARQRTEDPQRQLFCGPDRLGKQALKRMGPQTDSQASSSPGRSLVYEGQPVGVAMVAADSRRYRPGGPESGARSSGKELPFVLDQEEAFKPDAPVLLHGRGFQSEFRKGTWWSTLCTTWGIWRKALREADHRSSNFKCQKRNAHLWAGAEMPCVIARNGRGDQHRNVESYSNSPIIPERSS